jgi:hypothetical protein
MANVHCYPGDEFSDKIYYDSSFPGSIIYHAEDALRLTKEDEHPAVRAYYLQAYDWALNAEGQVEQKAQYYHQLKEKQQLFGDPETQKGSLYYGPQGRVIAARLRPANAKPLRVVNDN